MLGQHVGKYRIVGKLGAGGMGSVYEAVDESIGRRVALKLLRPELSADPEGAARFRNEARATNIVEHAGLVQIYELGQLENGSLYIVMELLKGESLRARMDRHGGRLPVADTLRLSRQIASALAAAHERGIVHRDLKPDNIMVVPEPEMPGGERIKLVDFGIAKLFADQTGVSAHIKTQTGVLMGTPLYMSPEQCRGDSSVGDRSDVYSLGVILFQALCGSPPFFAEGMGALIGKHIYEAPPALRSLFVGPGLDAEVAVLVHAMLTKAPEARPAMREVAARLEQLGAPRVSVPLQVAGVGMAAPATLITPAALSSLGRAIGQTDRPPARRSWWAAALLGGIVIVALVGVALILPPFHSAARIRQAPDLWEVLAPISAPAVVPAPLPVPAPAPLPGREEAEKPPAKKASVSKPARPRPAAKERPYVEPYIVK